MAKPLRIGVLGLVHDHVWGILETFHKLEPGTAVAVADPNQPLLERAKSSYGCAVYSDYEQMLEKERLDGVCLYSDNATGERLAELAAAKKLPMMIEKPLASSYTGAQRIVNAAQNAAVPLMVNWPFAWWGALQQAIRLAQDGAIGQLWQVKYRAAHGGPKGIGCSPYFCDWLYDRRRNGAGALMDYCCYGAALAGLLLGRPRQVTALAGRLVHTDQEVDDNAVILMQYPNASAIAEASWSQVDKATAYKPFLYGTTGTIMVVRGQGSGLLLADREKPAGKELHVPQPPEHLQSGPGHFMHLIRTGELPYPLCNAETNLIAQQILQAGLDASESGRTVVLAD